MIFHKASRHLGLGVLFISSFLGGHDAVANGAARPATCSDAISQNITQSTVLMSFMSNNAGPDEDWIMDNNELGEPGALERFQSNVQSQMAALDKSTSAALKICDASAHELELLKMSRDLADYAKAEVTVNLLSLRTYSQYRAPQVRRGFQGYASRTGRLMREAKASGLRLSPML